MATEPRPPLSWKRTRVHACAGADDPITALMLSQSLFLAIGYTTSQPIFVYVSRFSHTGTTDGTTATTPCKHNVVANVVKLMDVTTQHCAASVREPLEPRTSSLDAITRAVTCVSLRRGGHLVICGCCTKSQKVWQRRGNCRRVSTELSEQKALANDHTAANNLHLFFG